MSIATELSTLNDNILDAYTAVDGKGGTVPENKNTDSLATAITSIPTGGGVTEIPVEAEGPQGEGHITAYDTTTGIITGDGFGSTAGKVWFLDRDTHTYKALSTSSWSDTSITLTTPIDTTSFEGYTSICVEDADGFWTTKIMVDGSAIQATYGYIYFRNSLGEIEKIEADATTYADLGSNNVMPRLITVGNKTVNTHNVVGVMPNLSATYASTTSMLAQLPNLNQPIKCPATFTGNRLMQTCVKFNQPIYGEQSVIGQYSFSYLESFNQPINLPNITYYPQYYFRNNFSYNQDIVIPSTISGIGTYAFNSSKANSLTYLGSPSHDNHSLENFTCKEINVGTANPPTNSNNDALTFSQADDVGYVNGIIIKGTNRSAWLTALPNSTSSPYRKLIDGEE